MNLKALPQLRVNIKALIERDKVTQKALAFAIGKQDSDLSKFLGDKDDRKLTVEDLDRVADFFGVSVYQLLSPGGSVRTERRHGERRAGPERRVGHAKRAMREIAEEIEAHRADPFEGVVMAALRAEPALWPHVAKVLGVRVPKIRKVSRSSAGIESRE